MVLPLLCGKSSMVLALLCGKSSNFLALLLTKALHLAAKLPAKLGGARTNEDRKRHHNGNRRQGNTNPLCIH